MPSQDIPGPGSYNANKSMTTIPIKICKTERNIPKMSDSSAGLVGYNLAQDFSDNKGPKFTFGKERKSTEVNRSCAPGPGAYEAKGITGTEGRKISFHPSITYNRLLSRLASSFAMKNKDWVKGCRGKHSGENSRPESRGTCKTARAKGYVIDSAREVNARQRSNTELNVTYTKMKRDSVPGPGAYNPSIKALERSNHGVKMSTEARVVKPFNIQNDTPGPGTYPYSSTLNGPKYKFGKEKKCARRLDKSVPGPGAYKLPCTFAKPEHYKLPNKE